MVCNPTLIRLHPVSSSIGLLSAIYAVGSGSEGCGGLGAGFLRLPSLLDVWPQGCGQVAESSQRGTHKRGSFWGNKRGTGGTACSEMARWHALQHLEPMDGRRCRSQIPADKEVYLGTFTERDFHLAPRSGIQDCDICTSLVNIPQP